MTRHRQARTVRRAVLAAALAGLLAAPTAHAAGGLPPHSGAIVDLADMLDASQEAELATVAADAAADGTVVIEVLTVDAMADWTAGTGDIESFAQDVFDAWGIGDPTTNNGALIVVSRTDRTARIELGLGFAGRYDPAMDTVMNEAILPRFRQGDFGGGIVEGARRVVARLRDAPVTPAEPSAQPVASDSSGGSDGGDGTFPWLPVGGGALAAAAGGGAFAKSRVKKCPKCSTRCALVSEADDDVFLDDGQRCEKFLRSVDHRAWKCPACSNVVLASHRRWFTRAKPCGACGYRTASSTQTTLSAANYSSSGTALVVTGCQNRPCGHRSERHITLPQLRRSTGSSGGSGGSRNFSSRSSGGRSGGGGSSGSW